MRFVEDLVVSIPNWRLAYFAVPRSGNTSIKLAFAKTLGYDEEFFVSSKWPHATPALGVHNRMLAPWTTENINTEEIIKNIRAGDWFGFTVVRDPLKRIYSSWQLLVLMQDPHLRAMGRQVLSSKNVQLNSFTEIREAFQEFLNSKDLANLAEEDVHFIPQASLLKGVLSDIKIFDLGSMHLLQNQLDDHFSKLALTPPYITFNNDSLLPSKLIDYSLLDLSNFFSLYKEDYDLFRYVRQNSLDDFEAKIDFEKILLSNLNYIRKTHARISWLWENRTQLDVD